LPVVVDVIICVSYGFMIAGKAKLKTRRDNFITDGGGETLIRSQGSTKLFSGNFFYEDRNLI